MDILSKWIAEEPEVASPSVIGSPYNVHHKVHVDFDLKWHGQEPDEMFEIYEKLGEGGYGAVYRARHKETGFTLAIKMIDLADEAEKIMHEIDILKKCRNANIVSYYGSVVKENKLWILMDYCSLGSISDVLSECAPLTEDQIAHVCTEVLKGLAYLHASKIIHRDVKAANILLTNQAHVKIVDFGISAQIDKSEKLNEPVGSPFWMAPEVIMETEHTYKCDIWSLGITVLEMAEGAPPHSNIHPFRALFLIPKKPPPTFSDPSKWSPEAQDFVSLCLQKQPHERPSAVELLSHPFITNFLKKVQGPEVLRSTIISYLKAKKEKQMKLKREIAKLGRPSLAPMSSSDSISLPSSPSTPSTPSPTSPTSTSEDAAPLDSPKKSTAPPSPRPLPTPAPRTTTSSHRSYANGLDTYNNHTTNGTLEDSGSSNDYKTMFVIGTLNSSDMPAHINPEPEPPKKESSGQDYEALQQMVIDTKIEICRVREEVSNQNIILKSELQDIKAKLSELTLLLLNGGQPTTPPQVPSNNNSLRKKTSSELSVHRR